MIRTVVLSLCAAVTLVAGVNAFALKVANPSPPPTAESDANAETAPGFDQQDELVDQHKRRDADGRKHHGTEAKPTAERQAQRGG